MTADQAATGRAAFGALRIAIGAAALLAPDVLDRLWFGAVPTPARRRIIRVIGVRDLVVGTGTVLTRRRPSAWLWAGIAADASDTVGTSLLARGTLRRAATVVASLGGMATGLVLRAAPERDGISRST